MILINEHLVLTVVIALVIGLVIGLVSMWFILRNKLIQSGFVNGDLGRELAVQKERLENSNRRSDELKERLDKREKICTELQRELEQSKTNIAKSHARLDEERRSSEEKIALLQRAEKNMTDAFENLSNKIIEEKSKKFVVQNKENIDQILNPLREQLGHFRKKIEDVYDKESKDRLSLYHEISSLKSLNEQMSKDAINLTRALKGDSKKRGDWGEVILERVLEDSGLKKGREYEIQTSYRDANARLFRPDVVVHLPNKRDVIIDSKVSLNAYERYYSASDEQEKQTPLKEHLASIRSHISGLKDKNYTELVGVNSLDMVLMFVPVEPALMLAFEQDESLFQDAFSSGIFLVSPSTLTMNLQVIQNMWRYEYQNRNAQEIAKRAADMYDKFAGFVGALEDIGDRLNKAQAAYQTAYKRLTDGKGNLVARVESIRKLGELKTSKQLPEELINKSITD